MSLLEKVIVWAAYLSLAGELLFLHVPSVASSWQIFSAKPETVAGYSSRQQAYFAMSSAQKLLLFGVPLVVVYGVFALPILVSVFGPDPLGDYLYVPASVAATIGIVLVVLGRLLTLWSTLTIRVNNSQQDDTNYLHTAGAFRWSRNPGLVGMFVFVIGCWLLLPSLLMALGIGMYVTYMNFKVRMEEDFLQQKFGDEYTRYCRRTARFLL